MKIKTANIRFLKNETESELKQVAVKEVFTFADELFFIHRGNAELRGIVESTWTVSHFKTGLRMTSGYSRTIAIAKEDFQDVMKKYADRLSESINSMLKKYGTANELPEGME